MKSAIIIFQQFCKKGSASVKELTWENMWYNIKFFLFIMVFMGVTSAIFGSKQTLIWVAIVVSYTMYGKIDLGMDKKQAPWAIVGIFLFIGIANRVAAINPILGIFINLIAIFMIMYIPSTKAEQKAYMPFILCYIFGQTVPVEGNDFWMRMFCLLLGGTGAAIIYAKGHKDCKEKHLTLKEMFTSICFTSERFILSVKMAIGVSIAMLLGTVFEVQKTLWIACSVMSLTQIDFSHTKKRFVYRIISTLIGAFLFILLFQYLIPQQYTSIAVLVLGFIYNFVEEYHIQIVFVTISALSSAMILFDSTTAAELRVLLVIIGCIIGFVINKLNFKKLFQKIEEHKNKNKLVEENLSS